MSKPNTSALDELTDSQKQQLLLWLESKSLRKVAELVAQDAPEGFGIKTHVTTLHRYFARHRAGSRSEDIDIARLLAQADVANPLDSATETLISDWAFEIASSPRRKIAAFKALSRWILKQREHGQREREIKLLTERLALDREKFEFDAARAALNHHLELGDILKSDQTDNTDKINQARSILFGIPVSELPK